ncbi:MAG: nucleotidyltransferase [Chloroflexi bacterium HGW-Chloroflexi-1]|nr:MAG: nucleotidyltransferase [Chloroflexi bacterium HGW-Chloroflexi-1]
MQNLDFDLLRGVVASGPPPLFATVSGAHLYGFPSPDSDVDLRGAFVLPVRDVLRLREPVETRTVMRTIAGVEVDWVAHDVRKFARLMTQRNGYVLEQLYSPLVVVGGPWLDELRAIGRGCITRQLYHHYRGFADHQMKLLAQPAATLKELLYAYRVRLTGIHVLRTAAIEAHLGQLAAGYPVPGLAELMARKVAGAERGALTADELPPHLAQLARLDADLAAAFDACALPDAPTSVAALDDFVVRARLELDNYG